MVTKSTQNRVEAAWIGAKINTATAPIMLTLGDILEWGNYGFDNRALAGQKLIGQLHQAVF